jgi:ATP-dependent DNA ligase
LLHAAACLSPILRPPRSTGARLVGRLSFANTSAWPDDSDQPWEIAREEWAAVSIAFDVLYRNGVDLTDRPLHERRTQLEDLVAGGDLVFPVRRLAPNGLEAWAMVLERGYEGWVGKDEASPYRGGMTRSWLKVKVPGWTDTDDRWQRRLAAR